MAPLIVYFTDLSLVKFTTSYIAHNKAFETPVAKCAVVMGVGEGEGEGEREGGRSCLVVPHHSQN